MPMANYDLFANSEFPQTTNRSATGTARNTVISVSELNARARRILESGLDAMWIAGELSNVVRAASGHWYFSLKDANAQVRCVMFRNRAQNVAFTPTNGLAVEIRALPSIYEPRGDFQLGVENMRRAGQASLYEAFEKLKIKLASEGLFDANQKREAPLFARVIGVVTSLQAAALRDVLAVFARRAPHIKIIIYPTAVQGAGASEEIAKAIRAAAHHNICQTLIVCRGGGSIEDLWAFNEEPVARALALLRDSTDIVSISGVGHETDVTIADFAADLRAATPTAAAELATPERVQLLNWVQSNGTALIRALDRTLSRAQQRIDYARRSLVSPRQRVQNEQQHLAQMRRRLTLSLQHSSAAASAKLNAQRNALKFHKPVIDSYLQGIHAAKARLTRALQNTLAGQNKQLQQYSQALSLLNPENVLARGYSLVSNTKGAIVKNTDDVTVGEALRVRLGRGGLEVVALKVN
jgi:exodeoxyribonuclease VII large subunit